jgi:DNA-binding CsgD family transcriptional regulator
MIQDQEDEISLVHELVKKGYGITEIANILGISERKVRNMINDCW